MLLCFLQGLSFISRTLTPVEADVLLKREEEEVFKIFRFCSEKISIEAIFYPFCGNKLVE